MLFCDCHCSALSQSHHQVHITIITYFLSPYSSTVRLSHYFTMFCSSAKLCCHRLAGLVFAAENCLLELFVSEAHLSVPLEATAIVAQVRHRSTNRFIIEFNTTDRIRSSSLFKKSLTHFYSYPPLPYFTFSLVISIWQPAVSFSEQR